MIFELHDAWTGVRWSIGGSVCHYTEFWFKEPFDGCSVGLIHLEARCTFAKTSEVKKVIIVLTEFCSSSLPWPNLSSSRIIQVVKFFLL